MNTLKRIGVALLGLLLIAYLCYHTLVVPYQSISTEQAVAHTARDTIEVSNAYIIRNETIISSSSHGSYRYLINNGERVATGGVIANVYANEGVVKNLSKIDDIDRQIANLESINNYSGGVVVDIGQLKAQSRTQLIDLLNSVNEGNYAKSDELAQKYLTTINRRQTIIGNGADFSSLISALKAQRSQLVASTENPIGSVKAPEAGYFVSSVDGYEGLITTDDIDSITPEMLSSVKPQKVNGQAVGKVVSDVTWYMAVSVTFEQALQFKPGDKIDIDISTSRVVTVPAKVERVTKSAKNNQAVLIFSCSYMNSELSSLRKPSVKLVLHTYEGLRVPSKAIRVSDGKKGVYISNGSSMTFVPVKELYNGNGYVLCERTDPLKNGLHIYDDVIVKGKNLYDGKSLE